MRPTHLLLFNVHGRGPPCPAICHGSGNTLCESGPGFEPRITGSKAHFDLGSCCEESRQGRRQKTDHVREVLLLLLGALPIICPSQASQDPDPLQLHPSSYLAGMGTTDMP